VRVGDLGDLEGEVDVVVEFDESDDLLFSCSGIGASEDVDEEDDDVDDKELDGLEWLPPWL